MKFVTTNQVTNYLTSFSKSAAAVGISTVQYWGPRLITFTGLTAINAASLGSVGYAVMGLTAVNELKARLSELYNKEGIVSKIGHFLVPAQSGSNLLPTLLVGALGLTAGTALTYFNVATNVFYFMIPGAVYSVGKGLYDKYSNSNLISRAMTSVTAKLNKMLSNNMSDENKELLIGLHKMKKDCGDKFADQIQSITTQLKNIDDTDNSDNSDDIKKIQYVNSDGCSVDISIEAARFFLKEKSVVKIAEGEEDSTVKVTNSERMTDISSVTEIVSKFNEVSAEASYYVKGLLTGFADKLNQSSKDTEENSSSSDFREESQRVNFLVKKLQLIFKMRSLEKTIDNDSGSAGKLADAIISRREARKSQDIAQKSNDNQADNLSEVATTKITNDPSSADERLAEANRKVKSLETQFKVTDINKENLKTLKREFKLFTRPQEIRDEAIKMEGKRSSSSSRSSFNAL